jgi:hypothetical protein
MIRQVYPGILSLKYLSGQSTSLKIHLGQGSSQGVTFHPHNIGTRQSKTCEVTTGATTQIQDSSVSSQPTRSLCGNGMSRGLLEELGGE